MSKLDKAAIRKTAQRHERDTGSSEVQITLLTKRIEELTQHLKIHKKDFSSRYGLLRMVNNRRNLLDYFKHANPERHQTLVKELGLRH
ncbi:MAG: 30S ribosomal protein S15 [Kiritimatiellaeota bacterium]|nr:30S ribosomal protein S15 [Kiritimatiellota bacterium]